MHTFDYNAREGILHAQVHGFWSLDDCERYAKDLEAAARDARRRAGHLRLLIDSGTHGVQSADVAARCVEIRKSQLQRPKDRIAVCSPSSLARRQIGRSIDTNQLALFATIEEARAWLLSGAESAGHFPFARSAA
ncbi:MAG: hypothetical protein ACM3YM_04675 [Sphingomonadales bacterium]